MTLFTIIGLAISLILIIGFLFNERSDGVFLVGVITLIVLALFRGLNWVVFPINFYYIGLYLLIGIVWAPFYILIKLYQEKQVLARLKIKYTLDSDSQETFYDYLDSFGYSYKKYLDEKNKKVIISYPGYDDITSNAAIWFISVPLTIFRSAIEKIVDISKKTFDRFRDYLVRDFN